MEIEKEVRYLIDKETKEKIIKNTVEYKPKVKSLDITYGYKGFDSLSTYGFVCRIRQKGERILLEIKKQEKGYWLEQEIPISSLQDGVNFYSLLGMTPYMFLKRYREVRKFDDLKIFIDEIEVLGDFVEIEYQDSKEGLTAVQKFIKQAGIKGKEQDLYGGIIKEKLKEESFKAEYEKSLNETLKEI